MAGEEGRHMTSASSRPLVYGFGEGDEPANSSVVAEKQAAGNAGGVPVTILTGFLGSGKTTLLNRLLTAHHGKRIAVIQNEFGEDLGLGSTVAAEGKGGEVFEECYEMNNGCICCSVRDELVNTLERIMTKRHKFDYVLVETTGMANPGPLASIFWLDDELGSDLFLDAIITLVDAKHVLQHLDDPTPDGGSQEAAQQIAFADRILLNKIDLVSTEQLALVEARVRRINPMAPIVHTCKSEVSLIDLVDNLKVDLELILDVKAFDAQRAMDLEKSVRALGGDNESAHGHAHGHSHDDAHDHGAQAVSKAAETPDRGVARAHSSKIGTVAVTEDGPLDERKLNLWLGGLLWESDSADDIFRLKGIICIAGDDSRRVLQGVHTLFEILPAAAWASGDKRYSKLVFIGRNLDRAALQQGLSGCRADATPGAPPA